MAYPLGRWLSNGRTTDILIALLALALLALAGCAAGTGPGGEIIVGWKVAELAESAPEIAAAAGQLIGTAVGGPLGGQLGELLMQGGGLALAGLFGIDSMKQRKRRGQAEVSKAVAEAKNGGTA